MMKLWMLMLAALFPSITLASPVVITNFTQAGYATSTYVSPTIGSPFIHAIGIYEAESDYGTFLNLTYDANIVIGDQGGNDLFLAVTAYNPVRWNFSGAGLSALKGVLIEGYYGAEFTGVGSSIVTNRSGNPFSYTGTCYELGAFGCMTFMNSASILFGGPVDSYIGRYSANGFLVTATAGAVPEPTSWAMIIAGFAMLGMQVRRTRRIAQPA